MKILRKKTKSNAINWDGSDSLLIDCYRVKIEYVPEGIRFYFFNSRENGGDSCVEVKGTILESEISQEKSKGFLFNNPFINPSKRFNKNDKTKEEY